MATRPPHPLPDTVPPVNPHLIADLLDSIIALLDAHEEKRWSMAFGRVREHVSVTVGAADPRSTARVVRDLLHMFRGGMGPFDGLTLERGGVVDPAATAELAATWTRLQAVVEEQLRS